MLKAKYNYKDFIKIYLHYINCENNTQEKDYYALLYDALSLFYEKYLADYVLNTENVSHMIANELTIEYDGIKDVLKNYPSSVGNIVEDLNKKFNPTYKNDTKKRRELLFDMIYFLYCEQYGASKKTITHQALGELNFNLYLFEIEMSSILNKIYNSREQKNADNWSLFYYKEDLVKEGYSCILPNDIEEIIKIGNYQIKANSFSGIAYTIKPIYNEASIKLNL